ncbi:peptide ABC transporter substrate-binding protein [Butyrivibrio sp. VCD2006]|uniref:peptide ABC transporter substrate-binding protein n=1 Tax=Butyrivibrio sp. VCD2006 TaxID=1280664 RepID=UPI000428D128|nr:peptide ABC transporter substrate-binding protein [Butyrivibrio sp. VCD2006]
MKKKLLSMILASTMVFGLVGCGGSGAAETAGGDAGDATQAESTDDAESTNATNVVEEAPEGALADSINVCLASEPATLDPALNSSVDGGTVCSHLFSGLAKWAPAADGTMELVPDAVEELVDGVENSDGTVTYTYKLRDGLKWSDGKDVTAGDFVFAWNRAAGTELAADYGYMFEVVDGYADVWDADDEGNFTNPDAKLNVNAVDDKTLEVTLVNAVPYWNELLAFPAYFPVREDVVSNESWATDPSTYVNNGPYTMTGWDHNSVITLTKNDNYVDADSVVMKEINFYLSDDANNMLANFENGDWQFIDDVPTNEIASLKTSYPDEFVTTGQLGTYYVCWNINENILPASSTLTGKEKADAEAEIRSALALLIDRNYIVNDIAQGGQVPASSFVAMGLTDADGSQFYENAGSDSSYVGYYDVTEAAYDQNYADAIETLKKYYTYDEAEYKFTDFPSLTYLYNTSESHKAIGEAIQATMGAVGIDLKLENQEWATFLDTRKAGDYSIARNGWLGDYNDPISFLDMWTTASGNNDVQFGKGDNASVAAYDLDLTSLGYEENITDGTWAETYDVLISKIKTCTDNEKRYAMMHMAENLLMSTGCICPIYYYTDLYMIKNNVKGFYTSPLGFKYFEKCFYAE